MAYEKQNFEDGQVLEASHLNSIEDGIVQIEDSVSQITPETIGAANSEHQHSADDIVSGILPIANGGSGAATAAGALKNLGLTATAAELNKLDGVTATTIELNYVDGVTSNIQTQLNSKAASSHTHAATSITSGTLSSDRLPTIPVAKGGTGAATAAAARNNLGLKSLATLDIATVAKGGTGATNAATARTNLGIKDHAAADVIPIANGGTGGTDKDTLDSFCNALFPGGATMDDLKYIPMFGDSWGNRGHVTANSLADKMTRFLPLSGGTMTGPLTVNDLTVRGAVATGPYPLKGVWNDTEFNLITRHAENGYIMITPPSGCDLHLGDSSTGQIYVKGALALTGGNLSNYAACYKLWEGTWTSGTINLSAYVSNFSLFLIQLAINNVIPARVVNDVLQGGSAGYNATMGTTYTTYFSANVGTTTSLTYVASGSIFHNPSGNHSANSTYGVKAIYGIKLPAV